MPINIEAWGEVAFVPIRQKMLNQNQKKKNHESLIQKDTTPKHETDEFGSKFPYKKMKKRSRKKINSFKKQSAGTQEQWTKTMRDETGDYDKRVNNYRIANSELYSMHQETKGEEDTHEPANKFVKDPRGRKSKFTDDDNKKYLYKENYRE